MFIKVIITTKKQNASLFLSFCKKYRKQGRDSLSERAELLSVGQQINREAIHVSHALGIRVSALVFPDAARVDEWPGTINACITRDFHFLRSRNLTCPFVTIRILLASIHLISNVVRATCYRCPRLIQCGTMGFPDDYDDQENHRCDFRLRHPGTPCLEILSRWRDGNRGGKENTVYHP